MSTTTSRPAPPSRVYIARLAGIPVFDPIGDQVGRVHDVVVLLRLRRPPLAVGLVVEVTRKRRVFLPFSRVTSVDAGAVITTGLVNLRRFSQRVNETLVLGELLDRQVPLADGSGDVVIVDVAIEQQRNRDWLVTKLFVRRRTGGLRRGDTVVIDVGDVASLGGTVAQQGTAALLATLEDLKPADIADVLRDLPPARRLQVAADLNDERLASVLAELGDDDRVAILSGLEVERAADVLDVMPPDDAADVVAELPPQIATTLLERMEPEEARDVRRLLAYGELTAGGLMTTEPLVLPPEATVAQALAHARQQSVPPALATILFVVRPPLETPTGRLLGAVHLQRALREPPHELLGSLLDKDVESVRPEEAIGTVTRLLATYNLTALPVVDDAGRLLGAVSVDDVLDHLLPQDWREADEQVTDEAMTRNANG